MCQYENSQNSITTTLGLNSKDYEMPQGKTPLYLIKGFAAFARTQPRAPWFRRLQNKTNKQPSLIGGCCNVLKINH
jgi:hypothetical protein